jgi:hypothetical protein
MQQRLTAILPCKDLDAAEAFFARLGFQRDQGSLDDYRMLSDGLGGFIHLNRAVEGWLQTGRNPFGPLPLPRRCRRRGSRLRRRNPRTAARHALGNV